MILSQLPTELRRLAAQIERGFDVTDADTRVSLCLYAHAISTPDSLRKWVDLMGPQCVQDEANEWIKLSDYGTGSNITVTAFYEAGAIVSELVGVN